MFWLRWLPPSLTYILIFLSRVWADCERSSTTKQIRLENSVTSHDVKIGTTMNISCFDQYPFSQWWKDGKRFLENDRVLWVQAEYSEHKKCFEKKLVIKNITKKETGTYTCYGLKDFYKIRGHKSHGHSLVINAVTCFKGYFCPLNTSIVKRCPIGTFSLNKNATSVLDCRSCTTYDQEIHGKMTELKTAAMFRTNCPSHLSLGTSSKLSTGEKIAITVTAIVFFIVAVAVVYVVKRYKKSMDDAYKEKLFPKDVELEKPHLPRYNDVFICYSSKNSGWVKETLHSKLKSQGFRTIIDYIDFEIGLPIHQNIVNSIYTSRKTIFVLSSHSLKSFYARRELHQALSAGTTGHQVIVIQYEKCKVPVEIVHAVYLDWTDEKKEKFWDKLYDAIRTPLVNETVV